MTSGMNRRPAAQETIRGESPEFPASHSGDSRT
jgi:hypothetical protein